MATEVHATKLAPDLRNYLIEIINTIIRPQTLKLFQSISQQLSASASIYTAYFLYIN